MQSRVIYDDFIYRNKQIQKVKELEQEITQKESMEVETTELPKGVLPADFFDDHVEGALAMGAKRKQAEKIAKE